MVPRRRPRRCWGIPRAAQASSTARRSSSTFASHDSWATACDRARDGPGPSASASRTAATKASSPEAIRQRPSRSTSGTGVDTTGRPAARYSRTLSGFELAASSFSTNGISATSKPLHHAGSSPYGRRPKRCTFAAPASGASEVCTLPSTTTEPPGSASATARTSERSTQSATRPKKPTTGRGRRASSAGTIVSAASARAKWAWSTPCRTTTQRSLSARFDACSRSAETTTRSARRAWSASSAAISGVAPVNAENSSTQW